MQGAGGARLLPALASISVGLVLWALVPVPQGITSKGWTLLSIFVSTIVGLVLEPLPVSGWALVGVTTALLTKCITFEEGFRAFSNEVVWLIVVSFFFAKAFEKTGLGERVACLLVSKLGSTPLGLAFALTVAESLLAPAMPSTSARAGGVFKPIIESLASSLNSFPHEESRHRIGAFLTQNQFQVSAQTANLFLTAAVQNFLCLDLAASVGAKISQPFMTWAAGAAVPALAGILLTPFFVYWLHPPQLRHLPDAPDAARDRLREMGRMKRGEMVMAATMVTVMSLWVLGDVIGVRPVEVALIGFSVLLLTGVLTWKECAHHGPAWDTLTWFAVLISMSTALNDAGVVKAFADRVGSSLLSSGMSWMGIFYLLHVVFFLLHYMFASQTAHVGALLPAFCTMMMTAGVPPTLAALSLGYNINVMGAITHYASGQAAVYYGGGYLTLKEMFSVGAVVGLALLVLWGTAGMMWWKVLGWW